MSKTDSTKYKPVGFREFLIGNLFDKVKAKTFNGGTGDLPSQKIGDYVLPMLSAGINNQGLNNYDTFEDDVSILKNVISISANGANTGAAFFQNQEFGILQDAYAIDFKDQNFDYTENIYLYVLSVINKKFKDKFSWTLKAGWNRVKELTIQLPVLANNQPDYEYMDYFVEELKHKYVEELDAWWSQAGFASLSDTLLTGNDRNILNKYQQAQFKDFLIGDLFDVKLSDGDNRPADLEKGIIPLISAGDSNNGVVGYFKSPTKIFKENSITVDMFGYVYYQPVAFQTVSHGRVSILQIKNDLELSENSMLYLATAIKKVTSQSEFGFSKMASSYRIKSLTIQLPVDINDQPDYDLMSQYMQVMKKLTIQTHRAWLDEQLAEHQSLI